MCETCPPKEQPSTFERGMDSLEALKCMSCLCPVGFKCTKGAEGELDKCIACPPGTYARRVGQKECTACGPGKFASQNASATCSQCKSGEVPDSENTFCLRCGVGKYSTSGDTECKECDHTKL